MYAVGPSRQKACQEKGRYFSSDSNFALPKKLRQCAVCSHYGLSTTPDFCNVCTQYGVIRSSNYGPKVTRHWPDSTDVPLFCKECSQYVLASSPRFCLACSQHDGPSLPDDHSPEPSKHQRTRDCFRNEGDYTRFLESCSNTRGHEDAALAHDFSPKGHACGGDDIYEVTVNRGRLRERSPQARGPTYLGGQDRGGSKSRGNHDGCDKGYGGLQDSVAKMVACYGAKATRRSRDTQCARSPARSPRTARFGAAKTPNSAHSMHTCADHGLTIPVAPCLTPCADHGLPLR